MPDTVAWNHVMRNWISVMPDDRLIFVSLVVAQQLMCDWLHLYSVAVPLTQSVITAMMEDLLEQ